MKKKKASVSSKLTALIVLLEIFMLLVGLAMSSIILGKVICADYREDATAMFHSIEADLPITDVITAYQKEDNAEQYELMAAKLRLKQATERSIVRIYFVSFDGENITCLLDTKTEDGMNSGDVRKATWAEMQGMRADDTLSSSRRAVLFPSRELGMVYSVFIPLPQGINGMPVYLGIHFGGYGILREVAEYAMLPLGIFLLIFVLLLALTEFYVRKKIVEPVGVLSKAARDYMVNGYDGAYRQKLEDLSLNSYAEFDDLRDSMVKMCTDIDDYVGSIRDVTWSSEHDAMTMLHNRTKFRRRLEDEYPYVESIYIAYLDVNNLKEMNDMFGHAAGDAIIMKLAEKLRVITSDTVHTYRWGGDEFLVVMCNYSEEAAKIFLDGWHSRIGRLNRIEDPIQCTVAYGGAYADGDFLMDKIVELADDAMYRAKSRQKMDARRKKVKSETKINDR